MYPDVFATQAEQSYRRDILHLPTLMDVPLELVTLGIENTLGAGLQNGISNQHDTDACMLMRASDRVNLPC